MKTIAILQSNYIPWKGYFDLIAAVDEFILYDEMQYTKNDWRNRNKIKTSAGAQWLTVPVGQDISRRICDVEIREQGWQKKHWKNLAQWYGKAPHYAEIATLLAPFYHTPHTQLSVLNRGLIEAVCAYLGITTYISSSRNYTLLEGKTRRLVGLCLQAGGTEYISGPAAKGYLNEEEFAEANIKLTWFDYEGYPEYPQLWGDFTHYVSILDLLFNCGKDAANKMRYVR
jgi:hypothetical protein